MSLTEILKKTLVYKKLYYPYRIKQGKKRYQAKRSLFIKEGDAAFVAFVNCMNQYGIPYWLEFGTLLGAYRDGDFVPNEIDIDIGAYLKDAYSIYYALSNSGFTLVREFHVYGENGLEQTYEYNGITIDIMYFYEAEDKMWCNGACIDHRSPKSKLFFVGVTAHYYDLFSLTTITFKGCEVSVPSDSAHHLSEIYGEGFRVYDPNFKDDLNKVYYPLSVKHGFGWIVY